MSASFLGHRMIRASAGSGKTHQLTNRYLGLLAAGYDVNTILATTFTRKAAGEIVSRVLSRLAGAAASPHAALELANELKKTGEPRPDFTALLRALLGNLHRVRIGTLDSFTIALAGSFSFELGLPAHWAICEEADNAALYDDALERVFARQSGAIGTLLPLLCKGETTRTIFRDLRDVVQTHYEIYGDSERSAWECLAVPPAVPEAERRAALEQLRAFDFSECNDKRFGPACGKDLERFENEQWQEFIGSGLAIKVCDGEPIYQRKQIPPAAQALYQTLIAHARSEILRSVAEQTRATWQLLDHFHHELWALKQTTGALRFDEVTRALVGALGQGALGADTLAFRLDGSIEHLLLDEFQDTSGAQWRVFEPLARAIKAKPPRSFFCVGDVKQAIYAWRGGMSAIFDTLKYTLGDLPEETLSKSRRSAQPIIDTVNQVFENLTTCGVGDKCGEGLNAWRCRFETHTTVKAELSGYVALKTGPAQKDGDLKTHRGEHFAYVAKQVQQLVNDMPGRTIAVLCRTNPTVARMIYELRQCGVQASEEGGNPVTDSPATLLILSLFTLADHPGHSIAWFHVTNSPLKEHLHHVNDVDSLSRHLRQTLLSDGYGLFVQTWAQRLAPVCDRRDLSRLQQLVDMAYEFEKRSTLRADVFVAWVRQQRKADPFAAKVRVMTIHGAKGLEFDVVVLPELEARLAGQPPKFVVGRDPKALAANIVCRYVSEDAQRLLPANHQAAFAEERRHRIEESLSLLYVAMTRAASALYMYIPGPRSKKPGEAWHNLLLQTLAPSKPYNEETLVYERGERDWHKRSEAANAYIASSAAAPPERIAFRGADSEGRRGLEHVAPSHREGQAKVALERLFRPKADTGMAVGILVHAWFELIEWLDEAQPTTDALRAAADKARQRLSVEIWQQRERLLANFQEILRNPHVRNILSRSAYKDPNRPGFPAALATYWTPSLAPKMVERERRFIVRTGTQFWDGSLDRVVWLGDGNRTLAADIIDFKTDDLAPGDGAALAERTEHYRPQLDAYRDAVARLGSLEPRCIAARLVFTKLGKVVDV